MPRAKYRYFESDPNGRYERGRQCIEVVHTEHTTVAVQLAHQGWYVGGQLTTAQAREMAAALIELADFIDHKPSDPS
jgi:hypothetical protein